MKSILQIFISILLLSNLGFASDSDKADQEGCLQSKHLAMTLKLFAESFSHSKRAPQTPICKLENHPIEYALLETLAFLERNKEVQFGGAIHPSLGKFDAVQGKIWDYFAERVKTFRWGPELRCVPRLSAYITQGQDGIVNLCPDFVRASILKRALILIHEARHFEGYKHQTCKAGPKQGLRGCDRNLEVGGSHAVELAALSALWPHLSIEEKAGQELEHILLKTLGRSFNQIDHLKLSFILVAYDETGRAWIYDDLKNHFIPGQGDGFEVQPGPEARILEDYLSVALRGYMFRRPYEKSGNKVALLIEPYRKNPLMWHRQFVDEHGSLFEFDLTRERDASITQKCRELTSKDEQRACLYHIELRPLKSTVPAGLSSQVRIGEKIYGISPQGHLAEGSIGRDDWKLVLSLPHGLPIRELRVKAQLISKP